MLVCPHSRTVRERLQRPRPLFHWNYRQKALAINMNKNNLKVARATIHLGSIPLEVFLLPTGEYRLSQTQIAEAVGKDEISFRRFTSSKSPEALPYKGFRSDRLTIEGNNVKINAIPIDLAIAYWGKEALVHNSIATRLLMACAAEAIERRADTAFGVIRAEADRQAFLDARLSGKEIRHELVTAIANYIIRHPELSDNAKHWMYSNVSEIINLHVFGRKACQLCKDFNVQKSQLRDAYTPKELRLIEQTEDMIIRLIDQSDIHPIDAVKDAATRLLIPTQTRKATLEPAQV